MLPHSIADRPREGEITMSFRSWMPGLRSTQAPGRGDPRRRGPLRTGARRPHLEVLEDRLVLSFVWGGTAPLGDGGLGWVTWASTSRAIADFNRDGYPDVASVDGNTGAL